MDFCPLFSGSSGNAIYVGSGDTHILIDAGMPAKSVEGALRAIGVAPEKLSAVLITHEHSDHIKGISVLARRYGLQVYAPRGAWSALEKTLHDLPVLQRYEFEPEQDFYLGSLNIQPYSVPHDAADPVGYCIAADGVMAATATDLGHMTPRIAEQIRPADILLLEANHDVDMLKNGPYPRTLQNRILGPRGHLSNAVCAETLLQLMDGRMRHVYLGHLSEKNNTPELAYHTVASALYQDGIQPGRDLTLSLTSQSGPAAATKKAL